MQNNKYCTGWDLHKNYSYITVIDQNGIIEFQRKLDNKQHIDGFIETLKMIKNNSNTQIEIAVESCSKLKFYHRK